MSESFINQITLDCLLNRELIDNHLRNKKRNKINNEDRRFYRKRIFNLFKELINCNSPKDIPPDVKYSYDNFVKSTIQYFKTIDNNDIIQSEYKDFDFTTEQQKDCISEDVSNNLVNSFEADKLMMRSIKVVIPTLDKYVKKRETTKNKEIILPKQKEINLKDPEFKNKGIKDNITIIYEGNNKET
jgi:hypothetical protein